jgi:hypothetical protein
MTIFESEDSIKNFLAQAIAAQATNLVALTADTFGVTRQTVHKRLTDMVAEGIVEADGRTRARVYRLKTLISHDECLEINTALQEDIVWRTVFQARLSDLPDNLRGICCYGLTEILNNAKEHSSGKWIKTGLKVTYTTISLYVMDNGVGVFRKIKEGLGLADDREAILELSKGKVTTDPSAHSGEGIFFTSRMFDRFCLSANKLNLVHLSPEDEDDWLIEDSNDAATVPGTYVQMNLSTWTRRTSEEVFDRFTSGDDSPGFNKTHVPARLMLVGGENLVSRSQAKRLLSRFTKFKEVMLDFAGIAEIGQGFADEVFRVFAQQHPDVKIIPLQANEQVQRMIAHVLNQTV